MHSKLVEVRAKFVQVDDARISFQNLSETLKQLKSLMKNLLKSLKSLIKTLLKSLNPFASIGRTGTSNGKVKVMVIRLNISFMT